MKKNTFVKILVTLIALAAVVSGAIAIYKKFFCSTDDDYDFSDSFNDENDIPKPADEVKRGYVSIPLDNAVSDYEAFDDEEDTIE